MACITGGASGNGLGIARALVVDVTDRAALTAARILAWARVSTTLTRERVEVVYEQKPVVRQRRVRHDGHIERSLGRRPEYPSPVCQVG